MVVFRAKFTRTGYFGEITNKVTVGHQRGSQPASKPEKTARRRVLQKIETHNASNGPMIVKKDDLHKFAYTTVPKRSHH